MFNTRHSIESPPRSSATPHARTAACLAILACFAATPAAAQNWLGGGANNNWSTAANWSSFSVPANGSALGFFNASGQSSNNNDLLTSVSSITFSALVNTGFTLGGNGLGLTGGVINSSTLLQTINLPLTLAGPAAFFQAASGNLSFGAVNLGTFNLASIGSRTTTISGAVTGSGQLQVRGGGTVVLSSAANTYSGGSRVENGTLSISNDAQLGALAGGLTLGLNAGQGTLRSTANVTTSRGIGLSSGTGGGRLEALSGTTLTANGVISGAGPLSILGPGTVALGGVNTYSGATTVNSGTLRFFNNASAAGSTVTVNSGSTLAIDANARLGALAGAGAVTLGAGTLTAGVNNASSTYSGVMSGAGSFVMAGNGTTTLSGNNSYSGSTTINSGTLVLSGSNAYSGGTAINGGTLVVTSDASLGAASGGLSFNGGTLRATGTSATNLNDRAITIGVGGATLQADAGAFVGSFGALSGTGALTMSGAGQFGLGGSYAGYTGATTIAGSGVGLFGDVFRGSTVTVNSGAALSNMNSTIGGLAGFGSVIINTNDGDGYLAAGSNGASTNFFGTISGSGNFVKDGAGTLTLFGNNGYTGATTVAAGTLNIAGALTSTSSLEVLSGATLSGTGLISPLGGVTGRAGSTIATVGTSVLVIPHLNSAGNLSVDRGVMVLASPAGSVSVSGVANVAGGTLIANGLNLGTTGSIAGNGTVLAAISGGAGATINASGPGLALGNIGVAGAISNYGGALNVGSSRVSLLEGERFSGAATLLSGNVTIAGGVLSTPLGIELNSGGVGFATLSGYGTIQDRFINQGLVTGGSGANVLSFAGMVSGAGSFLGNVQFNAGYSPGNSPASVLLGRAEFGAFDQLTMELGGSVLGTGYDHLTFQEAGIFGGTLNVVLIDGFTVGAGSSFDLFDGPLSGTFSAVNLPTLAGGLSWDVSNLYTSGALSVNGVAPIPEPETYIMLLAGLGLLGFVVRRRAAAAQALLT